MKNKILLMLILIILILGVSSITGALPNRCQSSPTLPCMEHKVWENGTLKVIIRENTDKKIQSMEIEGYAEKEWWLSWIWPLWYRTNCSSYKITQTQYGKRMISCDFKKEQLKPLHEKQRFMIKVNYDLEGISKKFSEKIKLLSIISN